MRSCVMMHYVCVILVRVGKIPQDECVSIFRVRVILECLHTVARKVTVVVQCTCVQGKQGVRAHDEGLGAEIHRFFSPLRVFHQFFLREGTHCTAKTYSV